MIFNDSFLLLLNMMDSKKAWSTLL